MTPKLSWSGAMKKIICVSFPCKRVVTWVKFTVVWWKLSMKLKSVSHSHTTNVLVSSLSAQPTWEQPSVHLCTLRCQNWPRLVSICTYIESQNPNKFLITFYPWKYRTTPNWKKLPANTTCKFVEHLVNTPNQLEESTISPTNVVWVCLNTKLSKRCPMVLLNSSRSKRACKWFKTTKFSHKHTYPPFSPAKFDWFDLFLIIQTIKQSTIGNKRIEAERILNWWKQKQKLNQQRKKKPHEMYYKTTNTFVVFA